MTPTPAQIEAVLDEFKEELTAQQRSLITDQICRLTAAAEVGATKAVWSDEDADRFVDETIERCAQMAKLRTFTMYRRNVPDATHNASQKNEPNQPQFEGVIWSDGTCTIRWLTAKGSTAVWNSFDDMMAIHGHPEYGSEIEWHDAAAIRALKDA